LTFSNAGFVGINGVTPTSALHVNGNAYVTGELRIDGGKFVINGVAPTIYFRDSNEKQAMIHNNGNLLYILSGPAVGTTDSADNWVANSGQWPFYINLTTNLANFGGSIEAIGNITAYVSDMRLKTKTSDIKEPLEIINKLKGFYYTLNDVAKSYGFKNNKQEIGLSAQDVQSVLPELVSIAPFDRKTDDDENVSSKSGENYLTVSYDKLAPVFVEAIKELNQKNISLTKENNELKEKYNKLLEDITLIKQTLNLV
jgi:chaperonin cofactor prefoldin